MKNRVVWSVEEVEGRDGSVSTEHKTLRAAQARVREVAAKPGFGVTAIRLWHNVCLGEQKVKGKK